MSYTIVQTPAAHKMFKKFPRSVREHLYNEMQHLKNHPHTGEQLVGILRRFRSFHPRKLNNVHYRVLYEVHPAQQQVIVRLIGKRENFYKQAEEMKLKPVLTSR